MTEVEQIYMHPHKNYAGAGVANAGLVTGIVGTVLGAANSGLLGGVWNGMGMNRGGYGWGGGGYGSGYGYGYGGTCDSMVPVTRYEQGLQQTIAEQGSHIRLLEADKYTDSKILDVYAYVDGRLRNVEAQIGGQAVVNAQIAGNIGCMQNNLAALNGLTKTVIPIGNVCPLPMMEYNSWTAPTTTAATTAATTTVAATA